MAFRPQCSGGTVITTGAESLTRFPVCARAALPPQLPSGLRALPPSYLLRMREAKASFPRSYRKYPESQSEERTWQLPRPSRFPGGWPLSPVGAGGQEGVSRSARRCTAVSAPFQATNRDQDAGRAHAPSSLTVTRGRAPDPDIRSGSGGQVSGRRPAGSCQSQGTGGATSRTPSQRTPECSDGLGRGKATVRRHHPTGARGHVGALLPSVRLF